MNRRILTYYYTVSALFLLFVLFFAGYRLKVTIDENQARAASDLESLRIAALSVYLAEGRFDSQYFRSTVRREFLSTPRIRLLSVSSPKEGILYLITRDQAYLSQAEAQAAPPLPPGGSRYAFRPIYETLVSRPFAPGLPKEPMKELMIEGIFRDLDSAQAYPILRELFYILLVYLLAATVFVLTAALTRETKAPTAPAHGRRPRAGAERSAGPVPAGLFSPDNGLGWKEHLEPRLGSELERAAVSDQDLSLLLVGSPLLDRRSFKQLAEYTLDSFPFRDLAFEYDNHTIAVILPDTDLDQALRQARGLYGKWAATPRKSETSAVARPAVAIGLSARNGRLISPKRLLGEAARALGQAQSEGGTRIIAFRADPEKYRRRIASTAAPPASS